MLDAHHATALHLHLDGPASNVTSSVTGDPPQLVVQLPFVEDATGSQTLEIGGRHAQRVRVLPHASGLAVVVDAGDATEPFRQHGVAPTDDGLLIVVGVDDSGLDPVVVAGAPAVSAAPAGAGAPAVSVTPAGAGAPPVSVTPAGAAATLADSAAGEAAEVPTGASQAQAAPAPAAAGGAQPTRADGLRFRVDRFVLSYAQEHPDAPPTSDFMDLDIELGLTSQGYVAPREGVPPAHIRLSQVPGLQQHYFYGSAIRSINEQIVTAFNRRDLYGVLVIPNEQDIDVSSMRDLRPGGQGDLRLVIWLGRLLEARTFASGDRVPEEQRIDNPVHQRIKDNSPIQPGDLLHKRELDDYLARLNRHPGRNVDVTLSAATEPGGVYADYLIAESRPYQFYSQVSNTGTKQTTNWRQRFGFQHNQLTNRDDILRLDYLTGDFDSVHGVFGSYESPLGVSWLRGRIGGNWAKYNASEFAVVQQNFKGDLWGVGGQLIWRAFQYEQLFLDLYTGLRYQDIFQKTDAGFGVEKADAQFFFPEVGLMLERQTPESQFRIGTSVEFNVPGVAGTHSMDLDEFGRFDVTETAFQIMRWDASTSVYLEPLLFPNGYWDPNTPKTSTLAHELFASFRGQTSFNDRVIPQLQRIVGGLFTVRGYKEATAAGDTGLVGRVEYRLHIPRLLPIRPTPAHVPVIGDFRVAPTQVYGQPDWDLILRGFFDAARTIQVDNVPGEGDDTLLGTGLGLELRLLKLRFLSNLSVSFDWGHALHDARLGTQNQVKAGDNRFHFIATIVR